MHLNAAALLAKGYTVMVFVLNQAGLDLRILGPTLIPNFQMRVRIPVPRRVS